MSNRFKLDWSFEDTVEYVLYTTLLALRHSGRSIVQYQSSDEYAGQRLRFELSRTFQHLRSAQDGGSEDGSGGDDFIEVLAEIVERMTERLPSGLETDQRYATVSTILESVNASDGSTERSADDSESDSACASIA